MNTKLFITAAVIISGILLAGIVVSFNRTNDPSGGMPLNNANTEATYTKSEVANHGTQDDCWTIIDGSVYDITRYIPRHPGGDEILRACGKDGTMLFSQRESGDGQAVGTGTPHSPNAREQLEKLYIGKLR